MSPLTLRAGPVQLRFEPALLWARHWMFNHAEILRAVYPALRDAEWNTLPPRIRWRRREILSDRFILELMARYGGRRPFFEWNVHLEGTPDGTVRYAARGLALETFRTNRCGFCVLHPAEVAGQRCVIDHTDGTSEKGRFPREISPQQPFFDIRAITHSPTPGIRVQVGMEGEVFEMEDQRNWTDASFKTYCRPLERPWPFAVRRGETIEQRIEVRVSDVKLLLGARSPAFRRSAGQQNARKPSAPRPRGGTTNQSPQVVAADAAREQSRGSPPRERRDPSRRIPAPVPALTRTATGSALTTAECVLTLERKSARMPSIGVLRTSDSALSAVAAELLRTAGIKHLRIDLDPSSAACLGRWTHAIGDVAKLGEASSLEIVLKADANERHLETFARHVAANPSPSATRWLALDLHTGATTAAVLGRVAALWSLHRIEGTLGVGVGGDFVDLNRHRPVASGAGFVGFGVDAQVHAFDEISILETLFTYPTVVAQARRLSGGLPVSVTPVRFGSRRTGDTQRDDPRLRTAFGGVWMLAALEALTRAKACTATFQLPRLEPMTPALSVLQACASAPLADARRALLLTSSQPREACGIGLRTPAGTRVLIANLRNEEKRMDVKGLPRGDRRLTLVSSNSDAPISRTTSVPTRLTLPPYGIVQIEIPAAP